MFSIADINNASPGGEEFMVEDEEAEDETSFPVRASITVEKVRDCLRRAHSGC